VTGIRLGQARIAADLALVRSFGMAARAAPNGCSVGLAACLQISG
jgi:hypothetical protein